MARPKGLASGRRLLATLRTSVSILPLDFRHPLKTRLTSFSDEYTALQKYISTYRDPKAHAAEDAEANAADAGKGKAWYQFWRSGNSGNATGADPGFVPDEMLEADIKQGISSHEVEQRRKRYGWNEITTEKENLFIKFLGFFTGPVLYGKSSLYLWHCISAHQLAIAPSMAPWRRLFCFYKL
jgi:magnesium-transporting ATPase (P-type)